MPWIKLTLARDGKTFLLNLDNQDRFVEVAIEERKKEGFRLMANTVVISKKGSSIFIAEHIESITTRLTAGSRKYV